MLIWKPVMCVANAMRARRFSLVGHLRARAA